MTRHGHDLHRERRHPSVHPQPAPAPRHAPVVPPQPPRRTPAEAAFFTATSQRPHPRASPSIPRHQAPFHSGRPTFSNYADTGLPYSVALTPHQPAYVAVWCDASGRSIHSLTARTVTFEPDPVSVLTTTVAGNDGGGRPTAAGDGRRRAGVGFSPVDAYDCQVPGVQRSAGLSFEDETGRYVPLTPAMAPNGFYRGQWEWDTPSSGTRR